MTGDPSVFAIESCITAAYSRLSFRALGYFTIIIQGQRYGVQESEATLLACSFDEVERRLRDRGLHLAPYFDKCTPLEVVEVFRSYYYTGNLKDAGLDNSLEDRYGEFFSKHIVWAPDGDAAFDDSSYVLQFDIEDAVRIIAFKAKQNSLFDPKTLSEVVLGADDYYGILEKWHDRFLSDWSAFPKLID